MPDSQPYDAMMVRQAAVRRAIAAEVRAEMARQNKALRDLADLLNMGHSGLHLRTRGDVAFRADELVLVADALGVPVERFLATVATEAGAA